MMKLPRMSLEEQESRPQGHVLKHHDDDQFFPGNSHPPHHAVGRTELQSASPEMGPHVHIFQQSVTLLAYMDPGTANGTEPTALAGRAPWQLFGMSIHEFPILIGAATGAAGLLFVILVSLAVWHCCRQRRSREKAYSLEGEHQQQKCISHRNSSLVPSESVVFLGVKPSQRYEVQLADADSHEADKLGHMTRSHSAPLGEAQVAEVSIPYGPQQAPPVLYVLKDGRSVPVKKRPTSQPIGHYPPPVSISTQTERGAYAMGLPQIPEISLRSCECLKEVPSVHSQYSSYDTIDDQMRPIYYYPIDPGVAALKTRSLPTCSHCRPRPLSTEDDLNELYAKVNFSKKRKNRMRNDSAAAIAINKSRSTFLSLPFGHKDTDSLVDNEAVVVYDERTAL